MRDMLGICAGSCAGADDRLGPHAYHASSGVDTRMHTVRAPSSYTAIVASICAHPLSISTGSRELGERELSCGKGVDELTECALYHSPLVTLFAVLSSCPLPLPLPAPDAKLSSPDSAGDQGPGVCSNRPEHRLPCVGVEVCARTGAFAGHRQPTCFSRCPWLGRGRRRRQESTR